MAGTVVAVAPLVIVFLVLQRRFIEGLTAGAGQGRRMSGGPRDPFVAEILAQPAALRRAGAAIGEQAGGLVVLADAPAASRAAGHAGGRPGARPPLVLLTGMGGSLDACRAILPRLAGGGRGGARRERRPSWSTRVRACVDHADVVVLVSQSGRSAEARRLASRLGAAGPRPSASSRTSGQARWRLARWCSRRARAPSRRRPREAS